jgi:hypothetical protein
MVLGSLLVCPGKIFQIVTSGAILCDLAPHSVYYYYVYYYYAYYYYYYYYTYNFVYYYYWVVYVCMCMYVCVCSTLDQRRLRSFDGCILRNRNMVQSRGGGAHRLDLHREFSTYPKRCVCLGKSVLSGWRVVGGLALYGGWHPVAKYHEP